tara:strand:- start:118 stop:318 length:201 start_codon:yes stop_codon:yes gene_type:complete
MSHEANTILKERCYDEALNEVNNMRLARLLTLIQVDPNTMKQIEALIEAKAQHKYEELPDIGDMYT